jgi:N-acetylneuraminate synthase
LKTTSLQDIRIGRFNVGPEHPPFVIAEVSGNHNGSLDRALAIVDAAAAAGAQAVKLQTYSADGLTLDVKEGDFYISDPKSLWHGKSLYELYTGAVTPWEWHAPIFARCEKHGMAAFSSPFDFDAVELLESLNVPCYKIASFEIVHLPLIRRVARTGKPMIMSTGMATLAEIEEAVRAAREAGCKDLILLKCTSTYPASPGNSNLSTIPHMREAFGCQVGLSDHTLGTGAAVASVAFGVTVIEKHVTLARADGGVDSAFSLEPAELKALVEESVQAWQAIGRVGYGPTSDERKSLVYRRSLYISKDIKAGDVLDEGNLRVVRPGSGLHPRYYELLLGRKVKRDLAKGTAVTWDLLD